MKDKKYPVLYATNLTGTLYKHCTVHPTLFFRIIADEELTKSNPEYPTYMKQIAEECYTNVINKFTFSQPLKVTNDKIPFIIFRNNIDQGTVKQFCRMLLDEIEFFTKKEHRADYMMINTLFMQIGKAPRIYRANAVGEKLTKLDFLKEYGEKLEGNHKPEDSGWLTPLYEFNEDSKKQQPEEQEEIVTW